MKELRFSPNIAPPTWPVLQQRLLGLFARSAAMGVLTGPAVTRLDAAAVRQLVKSLRQHHLLATAPVDLAPLMHAEADTLDAKAARRMEAALDHAAQVLEHSPAPAAEWPAMRAVFGDDSLGVLVGIALSSLRRYAAGERETPQPVAERLHWLALVVGDLAGGYNEFGIRRWFDRPRTQLGGRSPRQLLGTGWQVDSEPVRQVRALAAGLSGAQTLAA
jgi:uncharacterized protein (DUF2384 family)